MRATTPPRRRLVTAWAVLLAATAGLAGCVQPQEAGNGDPDVGPGAVHEEQSFNEFVDADAPFRTSVAVTRDSGNVEGALTLTDSRGNVTAQNDTQPASGELEPVSVTVRLLAPTPGTGNGDELRLLTEQNVTLNPGEGEDVTVETALENVFWDDYPEGAALTVFLEVEADDGPLRAIGHLRSFR